MLRKNHFLQDYHSGGLHFQGGLHYKIFTMNYDYLFFQIINNLAGKNPIWDKIGIFFAEYLPYLIAAGVAAFVIYWIVKNKNWKVLWQALAALFLSRVVMTEIIRWIYHRPRPFIMHPVNLLLGHEASGSFPSGHATFLFAIASIVYFYNKKWGWLFLIFSFLAGAARVFVGVHYPLDVLAGAVIGIFSGWLISKILK